MTSIPRLPSAALRLSTAGLLAMAALLSPVAGADQGFYLGAIGGVTLDPDLKIRFTDAGGTTQAERVPFEVGAAGAVVAGYTFAGGLRPELELGYRRTRFDGADGHRAASQAIGSLYYNVSRNGYFFYVGGGGGYANVRLDIGGDVRRDDDGTAVYSLGSGFGLPVGRQLMVGVDYRYVGAFDRSRYQYAVDGDDIDATFRYCSHTVGLSLRYSFGSALADSHPAASAPREPVQVVPVAP
jgi:outer membrane immunogenic protein